MPSVPLSDWSHMMETQNDQVLVTRKTFLTGGQKAGYLFAGLLAGAVAYPSVLVPFLLSPSVFDCLVLNCA